MSFSLPGTHLYFLPCDDLAPEKFEEIIRPIFAWSRIDSEYVFDDCPPLSFRLINMRKRDFYGSGHPGPHGPREREKLKAMVYRGEVVMLERFNFSPGGLFYINNDSELICRDPLAFKFDGAQQIIRAYNNAVARRDYSRRGGKPRPTALPVQLPNEQQPPSLGTINSKMAGRLLAAGGIYHQNPEMFAETARKLGGDAAQGFEQVLNEQTAGTLVALSSMLMLGKASITGHPSVASLDELKHYLGKARGEAKLLHNIQVIKMDYVRRDRAELAMLRRKFQSVKPGFYKMLAKHPAAKKRFNQDELNKMARGIRPHEKWEIHHKLPLDDSGENDFSNLMLIRCDYEHYILNSAQRSITRQMMPGEIKEVLWVVPVGVVYP